MRACVRPSSLGKVSAFAASEEWRTTAAATYFGVHDKSLRELYTSTSSDATFYKVGVLATPPIPASAGARARACQRSDPLSLSRSSAPDAKKKLAERIERKSLKSNKTVKHRIECWLRKLCQQVGASGLGSSLSLARP